MINFKECPKCGENYWIKKGKDQSKKQRYKCKSCGFRTVDPFNHKEETTTETNQYQVAVMSAYDSSGKVMDIDAYCKHYNLPIADIKSYKLVTHTGTPFYNIAFHENTEEKDFLTEEFFNNVVNKNSKLKKWVQHSTSIIDKNFNVIRGIYTDMHIGMDPNKKSISLYGGTWSKEDQNNRMDIFIDDIITEAVKRGSTKCIIDELGDNVDGWDGQTVRKGHYLPQNMTNQEQFDQAVKCKVTACDRLWNSNLFNKIIFNNVCNDNHAGDFGYIVNSAVKSILEAKYDNVKVVNHRRFISHYKVGVHTKILCHGKDMEDSKFGFKPKLDQAGEKKIINYILSNNLSGLIEFSKGDSHQFLFDYATSDVFDYLNHGSFAPPSQWVQTNFQKGRSGYSIQTFNESVNKIAVTHPKFF